MQKDLIFEIYNLICSYSPEHINLEVIQTVGEFAGLVVFFRDNAGKMERIYMVNIS